MPFTVIRGYKVPTSSRDEVCIYTLDGEKLFVSSADIEQAFENEAPKKGEPALTTFFVKPNATVRVEVQLDKQAPAGIWPGTIYKYLDDGGTISKSRDDLGAQPATIAKYIDDGNTVRKSLDDF